MPRTFIAIKIKLSSEYDVLQQTLRRNTTFDEITWVANELNHITLRFIGKTFPAQVVQIKQILQEVARETECFSLKINKLGIFGSRYCPRVILLGFEQEPMLNQLVEKINEKLGTLGFEPAEGNFVPHITLGRIKKIHNKKKFSELIEAMQPIYKQEFAIKEIILYKSQLEKEGPIYTELAKEKLLLIETEAIKTHNISNEKREIEVDE